MSDAAEIFEDCYAELTDAHCKIRVNNRDVIDEALCTGIELEKQETAEGVHDQATGTVRYLRSDEPSQRVSTGDVVEVKLPHMARYYAVRVQTRNDLGGAVRLEVTAEFAS